jgi:hypothetical protein
MNDDQTDMNAQANEHELSLSERMRELGRRSGEARRRRAQERATGGSPPGVAPETGLHTRGDARARTELGEIEGLDIHGLSLEKLIERLRDPSTPSYAIARLTAELRQLGSVDERESRTSWTRSPQVRPDYVQPDWAEVLVVAEQAGAVYRVSEVGRRE